MNSAIALGAAHSDSAIVSDFDYKGAVRSILPRLAATTDESDKLRRLSDDAANALRGIRPGAHDHAEAVRRL